MSPLQPVRFYLALFTLFLAAMVAGVLYFAVGMGQTTYLVTDGVHVTTQYLDKPRYDMHLQGLIFALSFLIAGALLLLLILLPDHEARPERRRERDDEAPQPRRRAAPEEPAAPQPARPPAQAAPQPEPPPVEEPAPQAHAAPQQQTSPLSIESGELEAEAPAPAAEPTPAPQPAVQPAPQRPGVSVEEEVLKSAATTDDLPALDFGDSRFEDTGDEDVVYGSGRVTEDAAWDFVQQYPDSAVKFLYRKTLDNKTLSPTEEDIYRNWEMRGLTRAKVREIVLDIMRWQSLPDTFPHEIWRELRDQIYEIRAR